MTLKKACINRYGLEDGTSLYSDIIEDGSDCLMNGGDVSEILHSYGFEPDYLMDVLDTIS